MSKHFLPVGLCTRIVCGVAVDSPARFTFNPRLVTCRGCRRALRAGEEGRPRWVKFCERVLAEQCAAHDARLEAA